MKKRILCLILCLLMLGTAARAETYRGADGWSVIFTEDKRMVCTFRSSDISDAVSGLQPGDNIFFRVALANRYPEETFWYMSNKVLYSLEDRSANSATAGGAYTYELVYTAASGAQNVLFSSDTVGGDELSEEREGLHEATGALEDFFYLDTIGPGGSGVITLEVALEGETQGNDYQDTLADLAMSFAVELSGSPDNPSTSLTIVRTGDSGRLSLYYVAMAVSGALFLVLAIDSVRRRSKERKKDAR